jgi:arabinogalactan endo-1,4-beta-galactosidase
LENHLYNQCFKYLIKLAAMKKNQLALFLLPVIVFSSCQKNLSSSPTTAVVTPKPAVAASAVVTPAVSVAFARGADVSWLPQMEAHGYIFKNNSGVQQDCLTILKGLGINAVRLRTWVNPSSDPVNGHCSQAETIAMAVRCQAAGLAVMIDFHYGDTWNSVGHQQPPAAWVGLTYAQTQTALYNYVHGFCVALKAAGVTPQWMQDGNEVNSGICHPVGSISYPAQMTGLLNQGYHAIKSVFPNTLVIIHVGQPQKSGAQGMLDAYKANGGLWDLTGCSSYAAGTDQPGVEADVEALKARYGKGVMMSEVGGDESNAAGTKTVITAWLNMPGGSGAFYWEPEVYAPFTTYASGQWDATTFEPTVAMTAF